MKKFNVFTLFRRGGKGLIGLMLVIGLLAMFGCSMVQDAITPCHIDEAAVKYANVEATSYVPYTSVYDAKRVLAHIDFNHAVLQLGYARLSQDDKLKRNFLVPRLEADVTDAVNFQKKVFRPTGAIGLAFPALFAGTFGAMFINTPKKKKEV